MQLTRLLGPEGQPLIALTRCHISVRLFKGDLLAISFFFFFQMLIGQWKGVGKDKGLASEGVNVYEQKGSIKASL